MTKGKKIKLSDKLSVIAIIVSFFSLFFTAYVYFNTTQPHTEFDELKERLNALDNQIERSEQWINEFDNESSNISFLKGKLFDVKIARDNAWEKWNNYEFDKANENISLAYEYIEEMDILYPYPEEYTVPLLIIIAMLIIVVIIMVIFKFKKPEK